MPNVKEVHDMTDDFPTHKTSLKLISDKRIQLPAWQPILAQRIARLPGNFNIILSLHHA